MTKRDHEWIEVGGRRWCMTCDAYQMRTNPSGGWKGYVMFSCPYDTPLARSRVDEQHVRKEG